MLVAGPLVFAGRWFVRRFWLSEIGWDWSERPRQEFGIVTTPTTVRTHNGDSFPPVFEQPLAEGTRFDVVDRRGDWLHVRLSDGVDGWIPGNTADVIFPPVTPWG